MIIFSSDITTPQTLNTFGIEGKFQKVIQTKNKFTLIARPLLLIIFTYLLCIIYFLNSYGAILRCSYIYIYGKIV